ncbi:MAG TPA: trigger factor [bacterium]|nr:trigger factor [bacterium]HPS28823.1 trigger factor [bacterium]
MDYKLNHVSSVEKEFEITYSADEVKENLVNSLSHLSKTVNIKGFRKGKVPANIIKQMYGKSIKDEAENHFISTAIQETVAKESFHFAAAPQIIEKSILIEGEPFTFKYSVEIFPKIDVELKPFEAEYTPMQFKEEMVDMEIESMKKKFTEYKEDEEAVSADKDRLVISFSGKMEDKEIDGTNGSNVSVIIGESKFVSDFEKALYGHKKGDKFTADVKFPENYQSKDLAGKTIVFTIEVNKLEKMTNEPEMTDEFLAGKEGFPKTVEELRAELRKHIETYIGNINFDNKKYIAAETYVKNHEFDVPPSILKSEIEARVSEYKNKNKVESVPVEALQKIEEESKWVTKRYIILHTLSEKLAVEVTEKDITSALEKEAVTYGLPVEYAAQLRQYLGEERLNAKKMEIRESKVLDKMAEKMIFIEKDAKETVK